MTAIQSIIIPENGTENPEMYFRGGSLKNGHLYVSEGEVSSLDTYYNAFCYTKYRDYTDLKSVTFSCSISGDVKVEICVYDGYEKTIAECRGESGEPADISVSAGFSGLPHNGIIYPRFTSYGNSVIYSGGYFSDNTAPEVKSCIVICTYKREQYVLKNIELLRSFRFSNLSRVFVVDNGKTLDEEKLSDGFVTVLHNKNLGGSGGFTRGLIGAYDNGFDYVVLMDDDIEFHAETVEQMTVFMSLLKSKCRDNWLSAAMLPLDRQWEQYEAGAEWNGKKSLVHKHCIDMRSRENLLDNLDNPDVQYGGWWTLCMPVTTVREQGLPYPFFIKFDDIEYGLRRAADVEIITMNGIGVRHEAFDKKISFVLEYYNLRNELTVNTLYGFYGLGGILRRFWYGVCKQLVFYRYENVDLIIRAADDFLKGSEFFLNCDEEALNGELAASVPKLKRLSEIPEWREEMQHGVETVKSRNAYAFAVMLWEHIVPAFFLKKEISSASAAHPDVKNFLLRKYVIQYQPYSDTGILTCRSERKFAKYLLSAVRASFRIVLKYGRAKRSLVLNMNKFSDIAAWRSRLGI